MKHIWCVFSVHNEYNQPGDNLEAWWQSKPSFEVLLNVIGGSYENEASVIAVANMLQELEVRYNDYDWRLELVKEGRKS